MNAQSPRTKARTATRSFGLRSLVFALAQACVALLGFTGSASAAELFAAPGASQGGPCSLVSPCTLPVAVDRAQEGDRVLLAPGRYATIGLDVPQAERAGGGLIKLPRNVVLRGAGASSTTISIVRNTVQIGIFAQPGSSVENLNLESQGRVGIFAEGASRIRNVISTVRETAAGIGCQLSARLPVEVVSDTACVSRSPEGFGMRIVDPQLPAGTASLTRLRNVTIFADGAKSVGIDVDLAGRGSPVGGTADKFTLDALSTIAKGAERDIRVTARRRADVVGLEGADVSVSLENSSYVNTQATVQQGSGARATITPNNTRANLAAPPLLLDAVHQAANSPTLDRGKLDQFSGNVDVDGVQDRNIPTAPDIGADERGPDTETKLSCDPLVTRPLAPVRCTAEVRSPANRPIQGSVRFQGEAGTTFSPPSCLLEVARPGLSVCSTAVTVSGLGVPSLIAVAVPQTHESSFVESFDLQVRAAHATEVSLACPPRANAGAGAAENCRATVVDRDPNPTVPTGRVAFTAQSGGAPAPGFFRLAASCELQRESASQAGCEVKYVPTAIASGKHAIRAAYPGAGVNSGGSAEDEVIVDAGARVPTQTTVQCAEPNLAKVGKPLVCSVSVADPTPSTEFPRGSVALESDASGLISSASCPLSGGDANSVNCAFTYIPRSAGPQTLFASYSGNPDLAESQGRLQLTAAGELLARVASATTLNCTPQATVVRQPVRCTARVVADNANFEPTGNVRIASDGTSAAPTPAQCALAGLGDGRTSACSFDYRPRKAGINTHTLTATYLGVEGPDSTQSWGPSQAKAQVKVDQVTDARVSCNPSQLLIDTGTNCVVTVTDTAGGPTPTGPVRFDSSREGDFPLGASCNLGQVEPSKSSCVVLLVPRERGQGSVAAEYRGDDDQDGIEARTSIQIAGLTSTTRLDCTPPSRNFGEAANCVATVTSSRGTTPNGEVRFASDSLGAFSPEACLLGPVAGAADKASCAVEYTPTRRDSGSHALTASYRGDNVLEPSEASFQLTVRGVTTETAVTCAPSPVRAPAQSLCSVVVADRGAGARVSPTGVVELASDGPGSFPSGATCQLAPRANAEASCDIAYAPAKRGTGSHELTGSYRGDQVHEPSQGSFQLAVTQNPTQAALVCAPESVVLGGASTCTVTVTDTAAPKLALSGQVSFQSDRDGGFNANPPRCTLNETALGTATCQISYTPAAGTEGEHTIAASYGGDEVHDPSQATDLVLLQRATTTRITGCASLNPDDPFVEAGRAARCTVLVSDRSASPTAPGGEVKFETNGPGTFGNAARACLLAPVAADPGAASCTVIYNPNAPGTHRLTGNYLGDREHAFSSGSFDLNVVVRAAVDVRLSCDPAAPRLNQPASCTASVEGGPSAPRGTIVLTSDKVANFQPAAECALAPLGGPNRSSCQVTYTPQEIGRHQLQARYGGDVAHLPGAGTVAFDVLRRATATALECPAKVTSGDPARCTVTVTDTGPDKLTLAGDVVDFTVDPSGKGDFNADPARCTLTEQNQQIGVATCSIVYTPNDLTDGAIHEITASYGVTPSHEASSDQAAVEINVPGGGEPKHATETTISCTPNGVGVGEETSCLAQVVDLDPDPSTPTGLIAFASDRAGQFSPAQCNLIRLDANRASCGVNFTPAAVGDHRLTATYGGDVRHEAGQPGTTVLPVVAERRATAAAVACVPPTVVEGSTTSCAVTVTDLSESPTAPTGTVDFESEPPFSTFPGGSGCTLVPLGTASATCDVVYAPAPGQLGIHQIIANYEAGDATHKGTSALTQINVITAAEGEKNPTTTTLTCEPTEVQTKTPTTCLATVTDSGDPQRPLSGRIEFEANPAGVFNDTSCNTNGAVGTATCEVTFSPDVVGTHTIRASFVGDDAHLSSSGDTEIFAFAANEVRNETTTELVCDPDEVTLGTAAPFTTCIATVTDDGNPDRPFSGRIELRADPAGVFSTTSCETDGILGTAVCVVTFSPQVAGGGTIAATFVGDANHLASEDEVEIAVLADDGGGGGEDPDPTNPTATALECAPATVTTGAPSTCTVTVTDTSATKSSLDGNLVDFTVDPAGKGAFDVNPARCVLQQAQVADPATCQIAYTPNETVDNAVHRITASYGASANHDASSDDFDLTVTVGGGGGDGGGDGDPNTNPTTTALECAPATVTTGAQSTCTATVTDTGATKSSLNGNLVDFTVDPAGKGGFDASPARCVLVQATVEDPATCQIAYTPNETVDGAIHRISASYGATATHEASADDFDLTVTVGGGGPGGPGEEEDGTTVICVPDAVATSQASSCTATVSDGSATPSVPTGRIAFSTNQTGAFGSAASCVLVPADGNSASCEVLYTPIVVGSGTHTITANFGGDGVHPASVGTDEIAVTLEDPARVPTATALSCAPDQLPTNEETTCIATVTDNSANPARPAGQVEFASSRGGRFSGAAICDLTPGPVAGTASCQLTYTPTESGSGNHAVFATYSGSQIHRLSQGVDQVAVTEELEPDPGPGPGPEPGPGPGGPGPGGPGPGTTPPQPPVTPPLAATAPNTAIKKIKPKRKKGAKRVRKTVVKYRFLSDQPGSTFQCKVDRKKWRACKSPYKLPKLKLKKKKRVAKHVLRVRAVNPQGLVDPTPAVLRWKVTKTTSKVG